MTDTELLKKIEYHLRALHKNGIRSINAYTSKSSHFSGITIPSKTHEVIRLNNVYGVIKEILIKANSPNFSLSILNDNENYLNETYTWLAANQDYISGMSAFKLGATYYVNVTDIFFQKNCNIRITTTSDVKFTDIVVIYNVRGEEVLVD